MAQTGFTPLTYDDTVGQPLERRGGRAKVTGTAPYSAEWKVDGLLYAMPVLSTIARGKVVSIDSSIAESMPGVKMILTPENVPRVKKVRPAGESNFGTSLASSLIPAAERDVYFVGQYMAAVIADSFEAARDAAMAVKLEYEVSEHQTDVFQSPADERPKDLQGEPPTFTMGDPDGALKKAAVQVDLEFKLAANHHNPIEPHATIADWKEKDGKPFLRVYDASQSISLSQMTLVQMFELKPEQVQVICKLVGGAFGCKGLMWPHSILAVMCSKVMQAPVKIAISREMMYGGTGHRTPMFQRVAIGADSDGKIESLIHSGFASTSRKDVYAEAFTMPSRSMYATANLKLDQTQCRVDSQLPTFMRAPPETPGMFALEVAMDVMADKLKLDPIEFRKRNEPSIEPHSKKPYSGRHLVECMELGAKQFGWANRNNSPRSTRDGHWLVGMGMAPATFPALGFPTAARVTLRSDGTAHIDCCSHELGTGTETVQCQLLSSLLGIPVKNVTMELGDSTLPPGGISGGSSTTFSLGGAVRKAVDALKSNLVKLASTNADFKSLKVDDVRFTEGKLVGPSASISIVDLLKQAKKDSLAEVGSFQPGKDSKTANHSYGAHFVEVGVDEDFGIVRMRRMLACYACGTIMNAKTARSQFMGAMIMGVGHALMEETKWDHHLGRITNNNLAEYHVPVQADIPKIDVMWITDPDFNASPIGGKGIGEIGITGVAAAISNAIYNATGRRLYDLPMTPERFLKGSAHA